VRLLAVQFDEALRDEAVEDPVEGPDLQLDPLRREARDLLDDAVSMPGLADQRREDEERRFGHGHAANIMAIRI
jgi:hypothetical protein